MAKVTIDNFADEVSKILDEYAEKINLSQKEVTQKVVKTGVRLLKSASRSAVGGKRYASGWSQKAEDGRLEYSAKIYNRNTPGLPHLLEFSHPVGNGGHYKGREHIKPVEDEIINTFERELKVRL